MLIIPNILMIINVLFKEKKIEKRSPQNFETGSHDKIIVIKEL